MIKYYIYIVSFLFLVSCNYSSKTDLEQAAEILNRIDLDSLIEEVEIASNLIEDSNALEVISELELSLIEKGLVNVHEVDSSILVDIKYSSLDNFMEEDMYGDFDKAFLQKDVAVKLSHAQRILKLKNENLSLLIYDAVRPRHIQQKMWDALDMPFSEKIKFVSNPKMVRFTILVLQ